MKMRNNILTTRMQAIALRNAYPDCRINVTDKKLVWESNLQPTPLSKKYAVKIVYRLHNDGEWKLKTFIKHPYHLQRAAGKMSLPHVYDNNRQEICLYDPQENEWNPSMYISSTIVPWTAEWLYYYEDWVVTGFWYGGGHHPQRRGKSNLQNNQRLCDIMTPTETNPPIWGIQNSTGLSVGFDIPDITNNF